VVNGDGLADSFDIDTLADSFQHCVAGDIVKLNASSKLDGNVTMDIGSANLSIGWDLQGKVVLAVEYHDGVAFLVQLADMPVGHEVD
jgi:hypothetical protein